MTITELIKELQELQKNYPNLYLSPKCHLNKKVFRRKDKYFVSINEDFSSEIKKDLQDYYHSYI